MNPLPLFTKPKPEQAELGLKTKEVTKKYKPRVATLLGELRRQIEMKGEKQ